jgi:hypothetical protein
VLRRQRVGAAPADEQHPVVVADRPGREQHQRVHDGERTALRRRVEGVAWVLVLLPIAVLAAAAVAALIVKRRSTLRITPGAVEFRNYPQPPRSVPLAHVAAFDEPTRVGFLASLRPGTAVLVLVDGSRVPVRTDFDPDAGYGVDALNARLEWARRQA